jgi:hypothetical protein
MEAFDVMKFPCPGTQFKGHPAEDAHGIKLVIIVQLFIIILLHREVLIRKIILNSDYFISGYPSTPMIQVFL